MPLTTMVAGNTARASHVNANWALCVLTDTAKTISVTHTWTASQTFTGGFTSASTGTLTGLTYTLDVKSVTAFATPSALSATQFTAFASTVSGAAVMGYGTTNDVALMNRAGTVCLGVGPNTTAVNIPGSLVLTGATVTGAPTWSSSQAITLSTATQNSVTTMTSLVTVGALSSGSIASGFGNINNAANTITTGGLTATSGTFTGQVASGVAGIPFNGNNTSAASILGLLQGRRGSTTRWFIGFNASDEFALLNAAGDTANLAVTDVGALTVRAGITATTGTFSGAVTFSTAKTASGSTSVNNATSTALFAFPGVGTYLVTVTNNGTQIWCGVLYQASGVADAGAELRDGWTGGASGAWNGANFEFTQNTGGTVTATWAYTRLN